MPKGVGVWADCQVGLTCGGVVARDDVDMNLSLNVWGQKESGGGCLFAGRVREAGTCVAISYVGMRFSEIITVYLAAGAPFCAEHFLKQGRGANRALTLLKAATAMLIWPLSLSINLLARRRRAPLLGDSNEAAMERDLARALQAKERLLSSLYKIQELARTDGSHAQPGERLEQETRAISESIEKYVGLTLAASAADFHGPPDEREMELCRIAGRKGDDLLLAGRCIHRRNAAQLVSHQSRARKELLHALATVREFGVEMRAAAPVHKLTACYLSVAVLKFYGHAINLLSLLEDETAAKGVARLLNAECARLRRLESDYLPDAAENAAEGEVCTTRHLSPSTIQPLSQAQTAVRG
jgi:hypothetical protein